MILTGLSRLARYCAGKIHQMILSKRSNQRVKIIVASGKLYNAMDIPGSGIKIASPTSMKAVTNIAKNHTVPALDEPDGGR